MSEAVYGKDHVEEHHKCKFYKIKYLKQYVRKGNKILAHPDGLPNFASLEKIHFIGHSMGAPTIRYLQYLLKMKYFEYLEMPEIMVRDSIFGSITCISGSNNGSYIVNNCGAKFN